MVAGVHIVGPGDAPTPWGQVPRTKPSMRRRLSRRLRDNRRRIEGLVLGTWPQGVGASPGPTMWTPATIALRAQGSEGSIATNRRQSAAIAAISGTSA